jgi:uncharacterized protein (TIGR03067 family)
MRRIALPLLLVLSALAFAPAPLPRQGRRGAGDDQKKIQGVWVRVRCVIDGREHPEPAGAAVITITGDRLQYSAQSDRWRFTLDPSTGRFDSRGDSPQVASIRARGVYRLRGDVLTICTLDSTEEDGGRARALDASGPGVWLQVFERRRP